jgi:hypothetical protein
MTDVRIRGAPIPCGAAHASVFLCTPLLKRMLRAAWIFLRFIYFVVYYQ